MPSMGGRFCRRMLHDDIQNVDQRVSRMQDAMTHLQAEVRELTAQVADVLKRMDAVEVAANPAKVVLDRITKPSKKAAEKD